ncbi:lysophospholipid acyltransferase family protein [Candidatus Dependentiae bacterium]|nr:lysophospholipid acyltransferase family protein [Candidatus Dependentiae bacterium]
MKLNEKILDNIYLGLILFISFFINLLPERIAINFLGGLIRFLSFTQGKRKKIIHDNFKLVYGDSFPDWRIKIMTNLIYRQFGMNLAEFLRLNKWNESNISEKVKINNLQYLEEGLSSGKRALILTAHIGNWDLMATAIGLSGFKVNLITKIFKQGNLVNDYWMKIRKQGGVNPIYYKRSIFRIKRALDRNELVGFVIDQYVPNASIFVNFMGQPTSTFDALAAMASKFKVPVIPILNHRDLNDKTKLIIDIFPPFKFVEMDDKDEAIKFNTQKYSDLVSEYIFKYPDQWIWMHRRWRKQ